MADYQYITSQGVIVPDTADTRTIVENEYKGVFGSDLVTTPSSPQGVLITSDTLARDEVVRNNAALANQINPNMAGGIFLDAIWALTGGERAKATASTVSATITGVAGTIIPQGSRISNGSNIIFESTSGGVIGSGGTVSIPFQSLELGPVSANTGTLTTIESSILGWEQVTNPAPAILGTLVQSDVSSRDERRKTLALQGVALPEAITSAVYSVEGVKSLSFRENVQSTTQVIDGISLVGHSIFVCVDGGTDTNVASAILANKSLGANFNGDVTVNLVDPSSGQTYPVTFARPDEVNVMVRVTISPQSTVTNPTTAVPEAILNYANGNIEGEDGFVVGGDVSPFEIAGAVNAYYPSIFVKKVEVSPLSGTPTWSTETMEIALDAVARITTNSVLVVIA